MFLFLMMLALAMTYAVRYGVFLVRSGRKGAAAGAFLLAAPPLGLAAVLVYSLFL